MKKHLVLILICHFVILSPCFSNIPTQKETMEQTVSIEDNLLKIEIDQSGRIVYMENKTSDMGNIIDRPADGLFKMVCKRGGNWEDVVFPENQNYRITKEGNSIKIELDQIITRDGISEVSLVMNVSLNNGKLTFGADIENNQDDL